MNSTTMHHSSPLSDLTPCLVSQVFALFFHKIAVFYFIFSIIDCIVGRILHSRYVRKRLVWMRKRKWIFSPIVWYWYLRFWGLHLKAWSLYLRLWICQSKHWARSKIPLIKNCMHKVVGLIAWRVEEVGRGITDEIRGAALKCPGVFNLLCIQAAMESLIVCIATNLRDAMEWVLVCMGVDVEDVGQRGRKKAERLEMVKRDWEKREMAKKEFIKRILAKKELQKKEMKKEMRKEISRPCAALKPNSKVDGRICASVAATYLKTDLENDSNRSWSNEHGNLSPGSSPPRRLTQIYDSGLLHPPGSPPSVQPHRPSPNSPPYSTPIQPRRPNPQGPSGYGSGITIHTPTSTTSPSTGDMYTSNASDTISASSSEGGQTPCASSSSSSSSGSIKTPSESSSSPGGIKTPSESSASSNPIKTPSESSASSNPINTPSASGRSSGGIRTQRSTSDTYSEDGSLPGAPTSTSSSGSISTGVDTPSP